MVPSGGPCGTLLMAACGDHEIIESVELDSKVMSMRRLMVNVMLGAR